MELYLSRSMEANKSVLIACSDNDGNVRLRPASTQYDGVKGKVQGTIEVKHGIIKGKTVNLDLKYAKEVSGTTFECRGIIKEAGFKWSSYKKVYYNDKMSLKEKEKYFEP